MRIIITKRQGAEQVDVVRADGSTATASIPSKWWVPHDSVHLAVEQELGLTRAFWGLVADGHDPGDIAAMARDAGHASAKRRSIPAPHFVEAIQAERMVEAFEADQWSGGDGPADGIRAMAAAGCAQSLVEPRPLSDDEIVAIRARIADVAERWSELAVGESIEFEWGGE